MSLFRKLQLIALFMSMLIVMLPVCFASNFIEIRTVSGKNQFWNNITNIGYIGEMDHYAAEVEVRKESSTGVPEAVTQDMVQISVGARKDFFNQGCTLKTNGTGEYVCRFSSEDRKWVGGKLPVQLKLCGDAGCSTSLDIKSATLIIDDLGPEVVINNQPQQEGIKVKMQYSLTDKAYESGPGAECTGIKKVDFYDRNLKVYTEELNDTACYIGNHEIMFEMGGTGTKKLTLKATDYAGNEGDPVETAEFPLDRTEPRIVPGSFSVLDQGIEVHKISSAGSNLKVVVNLESADGISGIINADFSALSTDPLFADNITGFCSDLSATVFRCEWENVKIDKAGDGSSVVFYARDTYGNIMEESPERYPISIESTAPVLHGTASFALIRDEIEVRYASSDGIFADAYANLTDEYPGLDINNVYADFSAINDNPQYSKIRASRCTRHIRCTEIGPNDECLGELMEDYYTCVWRDVPVRITQPVSADITLDASDLYGNKALIKQQCNIDVDNTPPAIKDLGFGIDHSRENVSWLNPAADTKLTVVVSETGSGVIPRNVKFNIAGAEVAATNCTEDAGEWTCWVRYSTTGITDGSTISVALRDNAGNEMTGSRIIKTDTTDPVLNKKELFTESIEFIKAGDESLTIIANLTDASGFMTDNAGATPIADLSELFTERQSSVKATECILANAATNNWICKWEVSDTITAGARDAEIRINFTDVAGNKLQHTQKHPIRDVIQAEPNFYNINIDTSYILPIELFTIQNIAGNYLLTIPFTLSNNGRCPDASAYNANMAGSCSESLVMMQRTNSGYTGFIQFAITADSPGFDPTKIDFTITGCRLEFISRCRTKIYSEAERENVSISVPIVNEFIGPDDEIVKKVEEIKKDVEDTDWITDVNDVIETLQDICTIKDTVVTLITTLQALETTGDTLEMAGGFLKAIGVAISTPANLINKVVDTKIWQGLEKGVNIICGLLMCEGGSSTCTGEKGSECAEGSSASEWKGGTSAGSWAGGFCTYLKKELETSSKAGAVVSEYVMRTSTLDLCKKSFIFSVTCLCLPGIVYNLHKYRQLECWQGYCYRDLTAAGQMTIAECDEMAGYNYCVYWAGQLTTLFGSTIISDLFSMVIDMLENPVAYGTSYLWEEGKDLFQEGCNKAKEQGPETHIAMTAFTCIPYILMMLTETYYAGEQIYNTIDAMDFEAEIDYCKILLEPEVEQG